MTGINSYLQTSIIPNRYEIFNHLPTISNNLYQFEYNKKEKFTLMYQILHNMILKLTQENLNDLMKSSDFKTISEYIFQENNISLQSENSMLLTSCYLHTLNDKKANYYDFAISDEHKIIKLFKHYEIKSFKSLFVKMTECSDLPLWSNELDPVLLVYQKYLFSKGKKDRYIKDYVKALDKYIETLEGDLEKINNSTIYDRIHVLETAIDMIGYKRIYPSIKIVSDINLAFIREYIHFINLTGMIKLS